jgi:hypothetical protein
MRFETPLRRRTVFCTLALVGAVMLAACSSDDPKEATTSAKPGAELVDTWETTVAKDDLRRVVPDFPREHLCDNAGRFEWTFNADGTFVIDQTQLPDCPTPEVSHIEDKWSADGDRVTFTSEQEVYQWTVDGDQLTLEHVSGGCVPCKAINTANSWTRVE